jgi:hypothetical protein
MENRSNSEIEYLEKMSDKVRMGIPIDFIDAMNVFLYQEELAQKRRYNSPMNRLKRFCKSFL